VVLFLLREYGELDYSFPLSLSPRVWKVPNAVAIVLTSVMTSVMTSERNYTQYRLQLESRQRILDRINPHNPIKQLTPYSPKTNLYQDNGEYY